jgi:hypothetical protein
MLLERVPIMNIMDVKVVSESLSVRDNIVTSRAVAEDLVIWPNTQRAGEIQGLLKLGF